MNLFQRLMTSVIFSCLFFASSIVTAQDVDPLPEDDLLADLEAEYAPVEENVIADPLEPVNYAMYVFNDRLYFWVLKPTAEGYSKMVPQDVRVGINNMFTNVQSPIRIVGCLMQGKVKDSAWELKRFVTNSTVGVLGYKDVSRDRDQLMMRDEDFGQTLGVYGLGHGVYLVLPVFGPSSVRDLVGRICDYFIDPGTYLTPHNDWIRYTVTAEEVINGTSLQIGRYEQLKADVVEPYVALRDAYVKIREKKVAE